MPCTSPHTHLTNVNICHSFNESLCEKNENAVEDPFVSFLTPLLPSY